MADGYLESHYAEYEKRKAAWQKKQQSFTFQLKRKKHDSNNTENPA